MSHLIRLEPGPPTMELPANASVHDIRSSTPDEAFMRATWIVWSVLFFIVSICGTFVIVAILRSPHTRKSSFNIYLIALLLPDIFSAFCWSIVCVLSLAHGAYPGKIVCHWQACSAVWGVAGSFWMNALIAIEVYALLCATKRMENYQPPRRHVVILRSLGIYALITFIASMSMWEVLPHHPYLLRGMMCMPFDYNLTSFLFFMFIYNTLLSTIPVSIVFYIFYVGKRKGLLDFNAELKALDKMQTTGANDRERRKTFHRKAKHAEALTRFYMRIFVALLMWLPTAILSLLNTRSAVPLFVAIVWGGAQNLLSLGISVTKPDVHNAVMELLAILIGFRRLASIHPSIPSTQADVLGEDDCGYCEDHNSVPIVNELSLIHI